MSSTKQIIEGMQILLTYQDEPNGYHTGADHEVIYMYATDRPVSPEDLEKLAALGWHQEGEEDGGYDEDEGWYSFV